MNGVRAAARLHFTKKEMTFAVPLYITGVAAVITVLISLMFWRAGSSIGSPEWISGSRSNASIASWLGGFLTYMGVQSVATTFPFALTLGSTRRAFVGGTLLWAVGTAAYLTMVLTALTLLELATGHWFVGFHVFDVSTLGSGDVTRLVPIVFLGSLFCLTVGGLFGASWTRFGPRGPAVLGAGLVILTLVGLVLTLPSLTTALASSQLWWLVVVAVAVVIAFAATATVHLLRSATVR
ncbi:hypothetical protein AC792_06890 [Arthrobacter sp. RIT-PI-e]|uniref:hypothetical protein n=1 Tax=Arthrobacter sp. RIT-PI-e TaxID=1681197 RepID=UPI000675D9DE|nr:hypothetical protein [Arthrobacter sp. RIT-PI-e]KNC19307.1 hypothetical protein AC792_06890 [Arthrobacter sp. RIT-PI-e]